jgi:F-type H+-transporting ATPase subunit alpha
VSLRADEISSLIQKQIEGFDESIELKETGRVISVFDGLARYHGLENPQAGAPHCFTGGLGGMVAETLCSSEIRTKLYIKGLDSFVGSGSPSDLEKRYSLDCDSIINFLKDKLS